MPVIHQNNYGGYSNPAVDDLLVKAGVEQDNAKSLALYQQVEQLLVNDAAVLPLWFGKNYTLVKPNVHGYTPNAMGEVKLNEVSIRQIDMFLRELHSFKNLGYRGELL